MQFSNALPRLILHAMSVADENWRLMQAYLEKLQMSLEELDQQAERMHRFYTAPPGELPKSMHFDDEICEVLLCRESIVKRLGDLFIGIGGPIHVPFSSAVHWKQLQQYLAAQVSGRIPPEEQQVSILDEKLAKLFESADSKMVDWIQENGEWSERFIKAREGYIFRQLHLKKNEMFEVWTKRMCELQSIHGSHILLNGMSLFSFDLLSFRNSESGNNIQKY